MSNAGALPSQLRSILVITIQASTELSTQHIYQLNTSVDLLSGLIPLAVDHRIHHKYLQLLSTSIPSKTYDAAHVPKSTIIGTLYPIEIKDTEVSDISWTKTEISKTTNSTAEFPTMLSELSFQPEQKI